MTVEYCPIATPSLGECLSGLSIIVYRITYPIYHYVPLT